MPNLLQVENQKLKNANNAMQTQLTGALRQNVELLKQVKDANPALTAQIDELNLQLKGSQTEYTELQKQHSALQTKHDEMVSLLNKLNAVS